VASYFGTAYTADPLIEPGDERVHDRHRQSPEFQPEHIDKPGKEMALALHGRWMTPLQGHDEADVALVLGANPFKGHYGVACGTPGTWLGQRLRAGKQLLVVDPRRVGTPLVPVQEAEQAAPGPMVRVLGAHDWRRRLGLRPQR
jgi:hypothetical protein